MAKMEVDQDHFFSAMLSLEFMIRKHLNGKDQNCDGFGIVMAFKDSIGEISTYLISFDSIPNKRFKFDRIENNKYPTGHILMYFKDMGDLVTQAAIEGFPMVDAPKPFDGDTNEKTV